jgi:5'-nucleotidase
MMCQGLDPPLARRGVAQSGSALAWGASGRRFKSSHPDWAAEQFSAAFFFLQRALMSTPLILVTNDDGFHAPGVQALAEAMRILGDVAIAAPQSQQSGVGRHISLWKPLRARERAPQAWAVDGTPTDCVYLAIYSLLDRKPDLVISGINNGPNLAEDVWYSGTAAAALEGASIGIPSIAISHQSHHPSDFGPACQVAQRVARFVLGHDDWVASTILNVNVPDLGSEPCTEIQWTPAGRRNYNRAVITRLDPRGVPYYWIGGNGLTHEHIAGSDCDTLASGVATITPVTLETTDFHCIEKFQNTIL